MNELIYHPHPFFPVFFGKQLTAQAVDVLRERFNDFGSGNEIAYVSPMASTDTLMPSLRPKSFLLSDTDACVVDTLDWFWLDKALLKEKYLEKVAALGEEEHAVLRKQLNKLMRVPLAEKASLFLALMRRSNKAFNPYAEDGSFIAKYAYSQKTDAMFCASVEAMFSVASEDTKGMVLRRTFDDGLMESVSWVQDNAIPKAVVYMDLRANEPNHALRANIASYCSMAVNRMNGRLRVFILTHDVTAFTSMFSGMPVSEPVKHDLGTVDGKGVPEVCLEVM